MFFWFQVFAFAHLAASIFCAVTPTPAKDANNLGLTPLGTVYKIIDVLALNIGKAKQR